MQLATGSTKKHRVVSWFFFSSDIFSLGIQVCYSALMLPRSDSALHACLGSSQTLRCCLQPAHTIDLSKCAFQRQPVAIAWTRVRDAVCTSLQGAGAGVSTSANGVSQSKTGKNLLLAGLALQLFFFVCFSVLTLFVHLRPKYGLYRV